MPIGENLAAEPTDGSGLAGSGWCRSSCRPRRCRCSRYRWRGIVHAAAGEGDEEGPVGGGDGEGGGEGGWTAGGLGEERATLAAGLLTMRRVASSVSGFCRAGPVAEESRLEQAVEEEACEVQVLRMLARVLILAAGESRWRGRWLRGRCRFWGWRGWLRWPRRWRCRLCWWRRHRCCRRARGIERRPMQWRRW